MGHAPDTKLGRMYKEHIELILKKDIDGVLEQYTADALLISSFSSDRKPKYFRGHQELRRHFQGILSLQGLDVDLTFWAETDPGNRSERRTETTSRTVSCRGGAGPSLGARTKRAPSTVMENSPEPRNP